MFKNFLPFLNNTKEDSESRPRPSRTPSPTPNPSATPTGSPTPTASPSPSATPGPTATSSPTPTATIPGNTTQRIVIDPLTRIEGHLRIEAQIENGVIVDAWSSSTMYRGIEPIMQGRDPREVWALAQRLCGVCTTVHAISSVRAVENALGISIPGNARIIRNLLEAAQYVQDHVVHFYHLHALDWVDVVSALSASPTATSALAQKISDWPNNTAEYFTQVKNRLQTFVNSGQLGIFANGYWGHPRYVLPAEGNLLAVAHYLEALDWQREFIKIHAYLGGKNPHPQTYSVGGMTIPIDPSSTRALNATKISQMRTLINQARDFVAKVYLPDLKLIGSFYLDWANLGMGVGNYLSFGDFPLDDSPGFGSYYLPQGVIFNKNLDAAPQALDQQQIKEYVTHSWYAYSDGDLVGKHPYQGESQVNFTGPQPPFDNLDTDHKYSWLKTPRYLEQPMEVGPLARILVAYAAGSPPVRTAVDQVLAGLGVGREALFSTLGRVVARGVETQLLVEQMGPWLTELETNMNSGNLAVHNGTLWDPATWPAEALGWGITEAPRGALGHWVKIVNGKVANYQMVVATVWNGSPRDVNGIRGPFEQSLIGTPIVDPQRPVEILRTIHSFDPCMACSVHLVDATGKELGVGATGLSVSVH